jgi:serine/threonine protein phosphatase PrpC
VSVPDSHEFPVPGKESFRGTDVFGATHVGKVRQNNEDQFLVASLHKLMHVQQTSLPDSSVFSGPRGSFAYLLVVADGVGGNTGGELASGTAVETLARHIGETVGCFYNYDVDKEHAFLSHLEGAVERSHEQVLARFAAFERSPATTLTMVALVWPRAYVVHVGDSRAYYLRDGRLRQLTRDQTAYEDILDDGLMTDEQLEASGLKSRFRNTLTSAIGSRIKPSIGLVDLRAGDALLLCTDGLTKHVPDSDIAGILGTARGAEDSCRRLIDMTLERGARDNVTVVVAHFPAS